MKLKLWEVLPNVLFTPLHIPSGQGRTMQGIAKQKYLYYSPEFLFEKANYLIAKI